MDTILSLLGSGSNGAAMSGMDIAMNAIIVFAGTLAHFIKKCKVEKVSLWHYWKSEPQASAMSLIGAIVGFAVLVKTGETSVIAYFACGYVSDSALNRFGIQTQMDKSDESVSK